MYSIRKFICITEYFFKTNINEEGTYTKKKVTSQVSQIHQTGY